MKAADAIENGLRSMADPAQRDVLMRFFRTGAGEYGEGDKFLGVRVPMTRALVKEWKNDAVAEDVRQLTASPFHEVRLAGFLLLVELYKKCKRKKDRERTRECVDFYLSLIERGNNWDLVDMTAPKILGDYLTENKGERGLLYELASMTGLWHQRVAIVSNWTIIRAGDFEDTVRISELFLTHPHHLIQKATGWMLREMGKHGGRAELEDFLERHACEMPRTMLRYAIEHFDAETRRRYMDMKKLQ